MGMFRYRVSIKIMKGNFLFGKFPFPASTTVVVNLAGNLSCSPSPISHRLSGD
jgi:hypothetical protein